MAWDDGSVVAVSENQTAGLSGLSREEVLRFHTEGFIGPYALCTPDRMTVLKWGTCHSAITQRIASAAATRQRQE
jgi:hypothetical protein